MATDAAKFTREVTCDFFRVSCGGEQQPSLLQVVQNIHSTHKLPKDRNLPISDGLLRLYGWQASENEADGVLLRLRTVNSATIARISVDEIRDLQLGDDEALTEYFCFCYFDEFRTLVVHRNRYAGSHDRLAEYLERMSGVRPIVLSQMVSADALRRLDQMRDVTKAEIKLAMPENQQVLQDGNCSVQEMIAFANRTGAATITVRISMDHTKRPLIAGVKDIWRYAVETFGANAKSATIRGRGVGESDELVTLDLIEDRIQERVDLQTKSAKPTINDLHQAIRAAYRRRRDEIAEQFQPNRGKV